MARELTTRNAPSDKTIDLFQKSLQRAKLVRKLGAESDCTRQYMMIRAPYRHSNLPKQQSLEQV